MDMRRVSGGPVAEGIAQPHRPRSFAWPEFERVRAVQQAQHHIAAAEFACCLGRAQQQCALLGRIAREVGGTLECGNPQPAFRLPVKEGLS
jgi:hypothetical protein